MPTETTLTLRFSATSPTVPGLLVQSGPEAQKSFSATTNAAGLHLLLSGDRDFHVRLQLPSEPGAADAIVQLCSGFLGKPVLVRFVGRSAVRRRLTAIGRQHEPGAPAWAAPLDLQEGIYGAAPLFLWPDGRLSASAATVPEGMALCDTLVTAARWVSARRTSTFERLFPPSAFHPDRPLRNEGLSPPQARVLLGQLRAALAVAAVGGPAAKQAPDDAARLRSAALTILSHLVATTLHDPGYRAVVDGPQGAAAALLGIIQAETGDATARPALRAHGIQLLQLRAPALAPEDRRQALALLKTLVRSAPPYAELTGPWRFAMCSAWDFHEGEVDILRARYGFKDLPAPADAPKGANYSVLQAPFSGPAGQPIQIFARSASPRDENREMGEAGFIGLIINRHAQLGAFDMQATGSATPQVGYKLMMNSQCAGLTTRFALSRVYPDADIYSSWDSTYFHQDNGKVTSSEGLDCFVALLQGMAKGEDHAALAARMQAVQWHHEQTKVPGFCQFVGPSHPSVVARYADVNADGRADFYDGYLDLALAAIAEDLQASATPRDPKVAASQIGGAAASGLGWAAGSLNRVTQYSELWSGLPGDAELLYLFQPAGFYSHREPPRDVPGEPLPGARALPAGVKDLDVGTLPVLCRFVRDPAAPAGFSIDVMCHAQLSHAAQELKRLLCAAEALWRALDLGYLPRTGLLATPLGQRGMLLLMLAGLLEFPADQNFIDGLWAMSLRMLNLPPLSRSVVRRCITDEDHDSSNYYGSRRGLRQLIGQNPDDANAELRRADALAFEKLRSDDPSIGRPLPLSV